MAKNSSTQSREDLYKSDQSEDTVSLTLRVPQTIKDSFNELCLKRGTTMSQVLRRFMEREVKDQ